MRSIIQTFAPKSKFKPAPVSREYTFYLTNRTPPPKKWQDRSPLRPARSGRHTGRPGHLSLQFYNSIRPISDRPPPHLHFLHSPHGLYAPLRVTVLVVRPVASVPYDPRQKQTDQQKNNTHRGLGGVPPCVYLYVCIRYSCSCCCRSRSRSRCRL